MFLEFTCGVLLLVIGYAIDDPATVKSGFQAEINTELPRPRPAAAPAAS